jgi:hypothetical protein
MRTSDSIKELADALCKAQSGMSGAKKDTANPFFKSKYADLASCWEAARHPLANHGLSVIQTTRPSDKDEIIVITRLAHSSGEWIEGELSLPVSKQDAQGYGSALTYARRYGLCAIVGIAPEEDDGNAAAAAKPLSKPIPANAEGHELFAKLPIDAQTVVKDHVLELTDMIKRGDLAAALAFRKAHYPTHEDELILASQFPSEPRNKLKAYRLSTEANGSK